MVYHVTNIPSNISSDFLNITTSLLSFSVFKCCNCSVITLFRLAFLYLAFKNLRILRVVLIALSDSRYSSTYELINDYSGLNGLSIIILNS